MKKVDKEHYSKFVNLARENTCNTVYPMSIAEGFQLGEIYTDCVENPTFALFWHISGFAYLTGRPDEESLDAIYGLMQNRDGANTRRFVLELKDEEMAAYFQKKEDVERHPRYRFQLREMRENSGISREGVEDEQDSFENILSDGYEIREVDAELLSKISGYVVPSLFWESEEAFLEKGKGYCIVYDGKVVSVAFSAAVSSEQVDIGIETVEGHRRKGLAAIVAKKMVTYVKSIHKEPVWDCIASNMGSKSTAEKIGFSIIGEHAFYKVEE